MKQREGAHAVIAGRLTNSADLFQLLAFSENHEKAARITALFGVIVMYSYEIQLI